MKPNVYVNELTAPYFARRFAIALFELENLQLAYVADRNLQYAIADKYKYEKGRKYRKAQRAAFRADEDAFQQKLIEKRKRAILRDFHKVWGIYTNNPLSGVIIADYLKTKGNLKYLQSKYEDEEINTALSQWHVFVDTIADLSIQRAREGKSFQARLKQEREFLTEPEPKDESDGEPIEKITPKG